jgi:hypothetical protein
MKIAMPSILISEFDDALTWARDATVARRTLVLRARHKTDSMSRPIPWPMLHVDCMKIDRAARSRVENRVTRVEQIDCHFAAHRGVLSLEHMDRQR